MDSWWRPGNCKQTQFSKNAGHRRILLFTLMLGMLILLFIIKKRREEEKVSSYGGSLTLSMNFRNDRLWGSWQAEARWFRVDFKLGSVTEFSLYHDVLAVKEPYTYDEMGKSPESSASWPRTGQVPISEHANAFQCGIRRSAIAYVEDEDEDA